MAENLRVTLFNDGVEIPHVTDPATWYQLDARRGGQTQPAYCWYNNDSSSFKDPYGALYNFHAINSGKLCPAGWRVPTEKDFQQLIKHLDPQADFVRHEASLTAGGKLKETASLHWSEPNVGATNESGFTALPGGCRSYAGNFSTQGGFGYYGAQGDGVTIAVRSATGSVFMRDKVLGYVGVSVRCVKDN